VKAVRPLPNADDSCQHLTLMSIEVHACTRGALLPDPERDAITALLYCIYSDTGCHSLQHVYGAPSDHSPDRSPLSKCMVGAFIVHPAAKAADFTPPKLGLRLVWDGIPVEVRQRAGTLHDTAVNALYFETESALLDALVTLVRSADPDIVLGYEVQKASIGYLLDRAQVVWNGHVTSTGHPRDLAWELSRSPPIPVPEMRPVNTPVTDGAPCGRGVKRSAPGNRGAAASADDDIEAVDSLDGAGGGDVASPSKRKARPHFMSVFGPVAAAIIASEASSSTSAKTAAALAAAGLSTSTTGTVASAANTGSAAATATGPAAVKKPDESNPAQGYAKRHGSGLNISGRLILNGWRLMRSEVKLNIYTFENVVFHVLGLRVPHFTHEVLTRWWHRGAVAFGFSANSAQSSNASTPVDGDPPAVLPCDWLARVLVHHLSRAILSIALLQRLDLIGRTSELARVFGIQFYCVLSRGSQYRVESMMLRMSKRTGYLLISPSRRQVASQVTRM